VLQAVPVPGFQTEGRVIYFTGWSQTYLILYVYFSKPVQNAETKFFLGDGKLLSETFNTSTYS
jgi:hypothetical protein